LSNLGLTVRPDLVDSHTIHWHGFRNAIPLFDGVPEMSIAVPIGRDFTYFYHPHEPGTYMYHCHFEDVEHVQMGMTGVIFVKPAQNQTPLHPGEIYVYNDGNGSTRYDREYVIFLSEVWAAAHWADAHIQLIDWSEYQADFYLMNGRAYPDTIAPNQDPMNPTDPRLQYNPISSLISANSGEKVLLRFVNLGYLQHSMTLGGIPMRVVGKDATLLRGRDGTDTSYLTNTIYFGPGESYDAIFTAPAVTSQSTYLLYNRKYSYLNNAGAGGYGGQMTEARIYPAGTLPPQTVPNT
jgi:FtsP/CotA-like multicopper oxidase with cupredoxin domain